MGKILIDTAEIPFSANQLYEIMPYATIIPDKATNGDVIKLMFKSAWDKERTNEEWDEWWNSPYKEKK